MDFNPGVQFAQLLLVRGKIRVVKVADVDCLCAVPGELVDGGAADADGGVGACDDDDLVFYTSVWYV